MKLDPLFPFLVGGILLFTPSDSAAQPESSAVKDLSASSRETVKAFGGVKAVTRPSRDATMGFQVPTQIVSILVKGGQKVKVGDPLIRGDDAEDSALVELQKMRAETFNMRASNQQEYDRAKLAWERSILEYDNAVQQSAQEGSGLKAREARLAKLTLTAPFDGVIDVIQADVGQSITESKEVLRIVNVDKLWIDAHASIDDETTLRIKEGDSAWVLVEVVGKPRILSAKVTEVAPAAHPVARTRRIRVELDNPSGPDQLLAGDAAWVRFTEPGAEIVKSIASISGEGLDR